jgi:hypothetical protein
MALEELVIGHLNEASGERLAAPDEDVQLASIAHFSEVDHGNGGPAQDSKQCRLGERESRSLDLGAGPPSHMMED